MRERTDQDLVAAVQAGDTAAYGPLFDRYQTRIYNFAYGILGHAEDARDVTQDAFVRVFEALPRKEHVEFSAYLYRAARNAAYDVTRARGRVGDPEALETVLDDAMDADPERSSLFAEQTETVRDALAALSEDHRAVLMLREMQELSYQEIADALDMPRNTVGVLLMRSRLRFKGAFRMSHVDVDALAAECQAMLPKLSAYLDGELSSVEKESVESHLEECPLCRLALDDMREASKSYRAFVPLLPPPGMLDEVLWRIARASADVRPPSDGDGGAADAGGAHADGAADGRGGGADEVPAGPRAMTTSSKLALGAAGLTLVAVVAGLWLMSWMAAGTGERTIAAFPLSVVTTSPIPPGVSLVQFYVAEEETSTGMPAVVEEPSAESSATTSTLRVPPWRFVPRFPGLLLRLPATRTPDPVK
jgi:RNA polymerase sigma factor (sigma-70 family)